MNRFTRDPNKQIADYEKYYASGNGNPERRVECAEALIEIIENKENRTDVFSSAIDLLLPIWLEEVPVDPHREDQGGLLTAWFVSGSYYFPHQDSAHFVAQVGRFMSTMENEQVSDEVAQEYVKRMDEFVDTGFPIYFASEELWRGSFPVFDLKEMPCSTSYFSRLYLPHAIMFLYDGHSVENVKNGNVFLCMTFSPKDLSYLLSNIDKKALKSLSKLGGVHRRQEMTSSVFLNLFDAGFTTDKEVKDYARAFRISFVDGTFFDRILEAKRAHPVLADYKATV